MQLAIDTSTDTASIALAKCGEVEAEVTWHSGQNQTAELLLTLVRLLRKAKVTLADIDGVIVARGPGSFNGLRVGLATAKGLAFALGIPLVGIGTLEVEAFPHASSDLPICPVFDAGRGEIAAALYQAQGGKWLKLTEEHITTIESLCSEVAGQTLFCGSRLTPSMATEIKERLGDRAFILKGAATLRRAGFLAELGWQRLARGDCDDPATLQPLYLRRPPITIPRR